MVKNGRVDLTLFLVVVLVAVVAIAIGRSARNYWKDTAATEATRAAASKQRAQRAELEIERLKESLEASGPRSKDLLRFATNFEEIFAISVRVRNNNPETERLLRRAANALCTALGGNKTWQNGDDVTIWFTPCK